jgi:hypothetical protein
MTSPHYEPDYAEEGERNRARRLAANPLLRSCAVHGEFTVDPWDRNQRCPECMDEEERSR